MRRFGCSISSSTEPTGDRSWDVRTFLVGVVAVAFAVVLNCLVSLWCRIVLNEPLSHHCRSVDRCRYLNYLRRTRHCQRAMVVMNLAMTEEKRKINRRVKSEAVKIFWWDFRDSMGSLSRGSREKDISMVVETAFDPFPSLFTKLRLRERKKEPRMHLFQFKNRSDAKKGFLARHPYTCFRIAHNKSAFPARDFPFCNNFNFMAL